MFQGISTSDYNPKGKLSTKESTLMKKHNFSLGIKEWERPLGSVYKYQF